MANPYEDYYLNQAGNSLAGFEGDRYQKGSGFFSSIWKFGRWCPIRAGTFDDIFL